MSHSLDSTSSPDMDALLARATEVMRMAYAPYSGFRVGAALLDPSGSVHAGCNVENASYGLTLCAERGAISAAIATGLRAFRALAIVSSGDETPYPCGACRQVLAEFCHAEFPIIVASAAHMDRAETLRLGTLLPHAFKLQDISGPTTSKRNPVVPG